MSHLYGDISRTVQRKSLRRRRVLVYFHHLANFAYVLRLNLIAKVLANDTTMCALCVAIHVEDVDLFQ
jgi:predicted glycosyltransferase